MKNNYDPVRRHLLDVADALARIDPTLRVTLEAADSGKSFELDVCRMAIATTDQRQPTRGILSLSLLVSTFGDPERVAKNLQAQIMVLPPSREAQPAHDLRYPEP